MTIRERILEYMATTYTKTLYVDQKNGNDTNDGLSIIAALATYTRAVDEPYIFDIKNDLTKPY